MTRPQSIAALALGLVMAFTVETSPAARAQPGVTQVCKFPDPRFKEISGMARSLLHPHVLWLHNDSGGGPLLFAVNESTCATLAAVTVAGAPAGDCEGSAIARSSSGESIIWLGDVGDNRDSWPYLRLHRIPEPAALGDQTVTPAATYRFTYPDGPHDTETVMAYGDRVWVVTKQLAHGSLYAVPLKKHGVAIAKKLRAEGGLVTDGAISPDGTKYALRDYVNAEIVSGLPAGTSQGFFALPNQAQGEGVTWTSDGKALLITSERDARLLRVEPAAMPRRAP
jgi:hypothetical protein